ncbi:ROK family protein [Piscinibacter terrae]|nr:ROK family protein [Albitalea terrae]
MKAPSLIALDIGGTHVKYGLVGMQGQVTQAGVIDTLGRDGIVSLLSRLDDVVHALRESRPVGVAVSTLGIVGLGTGRIRGAADAVAGYAGTDLAAHFEHRFGLPTTVENDVNCVALAEGWCGAAVGLDHYIALTLGTGIGGGIVINGRLYRGSSCAAGEWGNAVVEGEVWEKVASLRGLGLLGEQAFGRAPCSAHHVFEAGDAGDPVALAVLQRWYQRLATGITALMYAFDPQAVIIGGGICGRGERFLDELREAMSPFLRTDFSGDAKVALAATGNNAGMLGAAKHWAQLHGHLAAWTG